MTISYFSGRALRRIPSTRSKNSFPPSSAGIGDQIEDSEIDGNHGKDQQNWLPSNRGRLADNRDDADRAGEVIDCDPPAVTRSIRLRKIIRESEQVQSPASLDDIEEGLFNRQHLEINNETRALSVSCVVKTHILSSTFLPSRRTVRSAVPFWVRTNS